MRLRQMQQAVMENIVAIAKEAKAKGIAATSSVSSHTHLKR
jgi:hypothetical protein